MLGTRIEKGMCYLKSSFNKDRIGLFDRIHVGFPLSNILGLVGLLKRKNDQEEQQLLINSLDESAEKLDEIIKEMNVLLEREMKLPSTKET